MEFRFACEVCSSINPQLSTINQSELPRGVIRSAPCSDTGGPGAKPGEAANSRHSTKSKHLRTEFYDRHTEQDDRAGSEPQLAGDPRAHAAGGVLHDGHQRGYGTGN